MNIKEEITILADKYAKLLKEKIDKRTIDMESDDVSHYLIYKVLGISKDEGRNIDIYQNKGRFLYKYAGAFLEEVTILCFEHKFKNTKRNVKVKNTLGRRPKTFGIDCLIGKDSYEIKWRDATTDGDHITKEHTRVKNIKLAGFKPIRIMFYYPNREQAIRIQETIKTIYKGVKGEYYFGEEAWEFVKKTTDVDVKSILEDIAKKNTK